MMPKMLENQLLSITINYLLQQNSIRDAVYLAEILHTEDRSPDNALLLAKCYYQLGKLKQARHLLANYTSHPQCTLLYVRCCLELNDYQSGLTHLQGLLCISEFDETNLVTRFGEDIGIAFLLLGDLNKRLHFVKEASCAYKLALKYNPFLWSAFESLCQLERRVDSSDLFKASQVPGFLSDRRRVALVTDIKAPPTAVPKETGMYVTPEMYPNPTAERGVVSSTPAISSLMSLNFDSEQTKCTPGHVPPQVLNFSATPPAFQLPSFVLSSTKLKAKNEPVDSEGVGSQQNVDTPSLPPVSVNSTLQEIPHVSHKLRRSARLGGVGKSPSSLAFSRHRTEMIPSPLTVARTKSRVKGATGKALTLTKKRIMHSSPGIQKSPTKKLQVLSPQGVDENKPQENEEMKDEDEKMDTSNEMKEDVVMSSLGRILSLLQSLGSAYLCLVNYNFKDAVKLFQQLPGAHQSSPWVLVQLGRTMMMGENFKEAARYFSKVHSCDPHRYEGMDLYGSALWHLQKETELSILAEELTTSDNKQPQTLCVLASLMNYYKDHDTAICYLERAIQLDPTTPYPQILLGLEYTLLKDYDKALTAFQSATNIDPYHFNAWYGLSHLYFQQEKWAQAEMSIKRSLNLNNQSSIAYTQLAMIQQKLGQYNNALLTIDKAIACNSSNHLPKFHKALILESMGKFIESLKQLEGLVSKLPKEPSFYKAMSRVLMKLDRPQESVLHMAWALDYSNTNSGLVTGMALVRPQQHRHHHVDSLEAFNESDFIPHSDSNSFSED